MLNQNTDKKGLEGRIALITGATRGIGRSVALAYAKQGAHCLLLGRTQGALEELYDEIETNGGTSTAIPFDLHNLNAIDQLGASIHERWGKLDILVANAGILGSITPLSHIEPKEWQKVLDINLTANWRLIRALDPLFRASDAARVIFVTSGVARTHKAYWATYAISKAGLEALADIYAAETANTSILVNTVNPGGMRTRMRAQAMPGEDPETLPHPDEVAPLFVELARAECTHHGETINFRDWRNLK